MITLISCNKIEGVDLLIVEPDKLVYEVGESFDPTGLEVSYLKNNGDVKELNADEYSISKVSINSTGVKEVTIKYLKIEKTFNVFVVAKKEAVTLVIKNYPTVQVYNSLPANSEIIKVLEVVVLFNDGKEETL
ncbi:MAG: bacterial Ig-like domain-containing protein [Acholeplasma sp.]|nr:bacterial Ig-like domain-containing protein [Acholeplasma sp.]